MVGSVAGLISLGGVVGGFVPKILLPLLALILVLIFPAGWVAMGISALRIGRPITSLEGASL